MTSDYWRNMLKINSSKLYTFYNHCVSTHTDQTIVSAEIIFSFFHTNHQRKKPFTNMNTTSFNEPHINYRNTFS